MSSPDTTVTQVTRSPDSGVIRGNPNLRLLPATGMPEPYVNEAVGSNLYTIWDTLRLQCPAQLDWAALRAYPGHAANKPGLEAREQRNQKLHIAFNEYSDLARRENSFYNYIDAHLKEGFSPKEWSIISVLLTTRAMPTSPDLGWHDVIDRNGGVFTQWLAPNLGVEVGINGRSHANLLFDMLRVLRHLPGKPAIIDNVSTHAIFEQLVRFRRAGQLKLPETPVENLTLQQLDDVKVEFAQLCRENNLALPAAIRASYNPELVAEAQHRGMKKGKNIVKDNITIPAHLPTEIESTESLPGKLRESTAYDQFFKTALTCAQLVDNDKILDYGEKTREQHRYLHADNPYEIGHKVISGIEVLSRESDSSGHTQVAAALNLLRQHVGTVDKAGLSLFDTIREKYKGLKWGKEHVDEKTGVEEDHANAARKRFMTFLRAALGCDNGIELVAKAFKFETTEGYLKLQNDHMDMCVALMERYRAEAIAEAKDTGKNPFIAPEPGLDPNPGAQSWTRKATSAVAEVLAGRRG